MRFLPPVTAVLFIGYLVIWRAWRFQQRHGRSPIHVPAPGDFSKHAILSRLLVVYFAALILLAIVSAIRPDALARWDPVYTPAGPLATTLGLMIVAVAAWVVQRAQEDMAASWRIGIDTGERNGLVTEGLFRLCRNPIYLGLMTALLGYCFMIPGLFMALLTASAIVLFHVQARLEEAYLLEIHGEEYARYCRRVGRFLPGGAG